MQVKEINVIVGGHWEGDLELFFGPLQSDDTFHYFPAGTTLETICHSVGLCKSKSEARRNGKAGPAPLFDSFKYGKLKTLVTILNLSHETHCV